MRNEVAQMEEESKIVIENLEKDFLSRVNNKQPGSRQHDDDDFLRKLKSRLKKENKESHISQIEEIWIELIIKEQLDIDYYHASKDGLPVKQFSQRKFSFII